MVVYIILCDFDELVMHEVLVMNQHRFGLLQGRGDVGDRYRPQQLRLNLGMHPMNFRFTKSYE